MFSGLKHLLNFFSEENNLNILFLSVIILSAVGFAVFFTLAFRVPDFTAVKKLALVVLDCVWVTAGICLSYFVSYLVTGYVLLACFNALCCYAVFCVPYKRASINRKQKELVRFIDQEIKKQPEQPTLKPVLDKIVLKPEQDFSADKTDLNFSHVKNILERLDFFPLSSSDKKQVGELRVNLNQAERGVKDGDVKRKINDGLGELLKIMSKYGV